MGNTGTAAAANPLLCFDGPSQGTIYNGDCTINAGETSATLITTDGDPDGSYAASPEQLPNSATAAAQIAASASQQAAGLGQIAAAMRSISDAAGQNLQASRQTDSTARRLDDMSTQLKSLIGEAQTPA